MNRIYLSLLFLATALLAHADNPTVRTCYTADPALMAVGDTLYMYTGHDEDGADFFWMQEWRVYSTTDMVNWTDHGSPLALEDFSWADDRAWASQCIERDGKYWWYICAHSKLTNAMAVGVAVGDTPTGPFRDAIGRPLADGSWDYIDPTVFIDDDGQAWLYWGNPQIYYAKLGRDMVSFVGGVHELEMTEAGFGAPMLRQQNKDKKYPDCYTEGPWIAKHHYGKRGKQSQYYLLYAAGGIPEHISYSTAPTPTGPWTYRGVVMPNANRGSFTNHCGILDFKGRSYFSYHTGELPGGGGFGRSAALEEFTWNADGTLPTILATDSGPAPIATLCPYRRVEAETMANARGVRTEGCREAPVYVSDIHNGDYTVVRCVDFAKGATTFSARVASALRGGTIEAHLDSIAGPLLAALHVPHTGGWEQWQTVQTTVNTVPTGTHDLFLVFRGRKGPKLFNFDYWEFKQGVKGVKELRS